MDLRTATAGFVLAFVLIGTPWVHACTAPKALEDKVHFHPDADTYTEIGNWFGDRKQYECALESFQSALKLEPGSAKIYYLIGLTLYASGHPEEALEPVRKSIYLMPEVLKPHILHAAALDAVQRHDLALEEWEAALRIDRHSTDALDGLGKCLIAAGDYYSAIELLRQSPHTETLTLDLAVAYGKANMLDKAAEVLTQALQKTPTSLPLTSALITVDVRQLQDQDALRLARKAVSLHPGNLEAQRLYLRVLVLDGDSALARPLAHTLLTAHPHDFDFLYLTGILENTAGQYESARGHLEEAVKLDPNYYNARYNLGVALLELKNYQEAREQLEKALALGATEPEIRFKYANALKSLGEMDLAKEQLKLYQQQVQTNERRAQAASKTAQADKEADSGDLQKATADYREAMEATPDNAQLAYKLSLVLDRTGDIAGERTALEQAVKLDPTFALAQNQLGYLASRDGDAAGAEQYFRQAVHAAPSYTQAWISLAATLGMESRFDDAQQALASALKIEPENAQALQLRKDLDAASQGAH
jgi:tetratricopeptide (TPR) repeat protein